MSKWLGKMADCIGDPALRQVVTEYIEYKSLDYFDDVGASGSGKYHPPWANGPGGLVRHTAAALEYAEQMVRGVASDRMTNAKMDEVRAAVILHDFIKYGTQERYEQARAHGGAKMVPDHGTLAAEDFRDFALNKIPSDRVERICYAIEYHMGIYGPKDCDDTDVLYCAIISDYLVSRKDHQSKVALKLKEQMDKDW